MVAGAAATALVLGYLGLSRYLHDRGNYPSSPVDLLYYDIQLFVLSSPPVDDGGSFPIFLQIARFSAPAVTIYAVIEAARRLFGSELARLRTRRARHHHVVCGDDEVADALAARLVREGRLVVRVVQQDGVCSDDPRPYVVVGDPTRAAVLRAAGVQRASTVYACTSDSAVNLAIALAVSEFPRRRRSVLEVHVQIDDPHMCLALQARRLGAPPLPRLQVNFFSSHELAARNLLAVQPVPVPVDRAPRLMIVGAGAFATALAVELARSWRLQDPMQRYPLDLTFLGTGAVAVAAGLRRHNPLLVDACDVTSTDVDLDALLDSQPPEAQPDRVYLCGEDEEEAFRLALTLEHVWHRGPCSVVVRLNRLGLLRRAFHDQNGCRLLDDGSGALYLYDAVRAGSRPRLVEDSLMERLGRAIHENYVAARLRDGVGWGETRAMRPWSQLAEELKAENRDQAADVGRKLKAIGCALGPSSSGGRPEELDQDAVETLARMEHQRWCDHRRDAGWRYGPRRDDLLRVHPDLVDWVTLAEHSREKDRQAVRHLPAFLSAAGFQIFTLPRAGTPVNAGRERPATVDSA